MNKQELKSGKMRWLNKSPRLVFAKIKQVLILLFSIVLFSAYIIGIILSWGYLLSK